MIVRIDDYCTERGSWVGRVTYISPREKKKSIRPWSVENRVSYPLSRVL